MESIEKVVHRINPVSVTGLFRHAFAWGGHVGKKMLTHLRGDELALSSSEAPVNVYLVHGTVDMASGCQ